MRPFTFAVLALAALPVGCECADETAAPDAWPDASLDATSTVHAVRDTFGCDFSEEFDRVAVNRPDGTPGNADAIDEDGSVLRIEPGDMVTASDLVGELQTYVGVAPGDVLAFGNFCIPIDTEFSLTAEWAAWPGASRYFACTTCNCAYPPLGTMSTPIESCAETDPGMDRFTVYALDAADQVIATAWFPDAIVSSSGTVAGGPWEAASSVELRVDELPASASAPVATTQFFGGLSIDEHAITSTPATWSRPSAVEGPPLQAWLAFDDELALAAIPPGTTRWTFAIPERLPSLVSLSYEPSTREVSLVVDDGGVEPDAIVVDLTWLLPEPESGVRTWRFVVPPDTRSFTLPTHDTLPATTSATDGPLLRYRVVFVERDDAADYAGARAVPMIQYGDPKFALHLGAVGQIRTATFAQMN